MGAARQVHRGDVLAFLLAVALSLPPALSSRVLSGSTDAGSAHSSYPSTSASALAAAASGASPSFVETQGTRFYLDGRPWYCAGTNAYYAAVVDRMSEADVDRLFSTHADAGATVMRVFAHSDGYGGGNQASVSTPIQPKLGEYNEQALRRLDAVVAAAKRHDIRLILPFTNFEPFLGGIEWYAEQCAGKGAAKELFYTNGACRGAYKDYVTMLTNRVNTITGVRYADEPAVMAWELMNEPHTRDGWERASGAGSPGSTVAAWIDEMAPFIKSAAPKQLLFSGEEGYRTDGPNTPNPKHSWINNGLKGVDFTSNCNHPDIDVCTVHVYPDNWGYDSSEVFDGTYSRDFLADRAAIATAVGKPIMMEEYGSRSGYYSSRDDVLRYLQGQADRLGYGCSLVWSVNAGDYTGDGGSYIFKYGEDGSSAVTENYRSAREKSIEG